MSHKTPCLFFIFLCMSLLFGGEALSQEAAPSPPAPGAEKLTLVQAAMCAIMKVKLAAIVMS